MKTLKSLQAPTWAFIFALGITFLASSSIKANVKPPSSEPVVISANMMANATFQQLLNDMNARNSCYFANITAVNVRNGKYGNMFSYTSHGQRQLKKDNANTISSVAQVQTAFSDRSYFSGKKDNQSVKISSSGSTINVEIILNTWGNAKINLTNVKISKERFGYFITGETSDGRRSAHYTLGIYKGECPPF